jgi:cytochrome c551/c552
MKYFVILVVLAFTYVACGESSSSSSDKASETKEEGSSEVSDKGIGETKNVELNDPLDPSMVESGEAIYQLKCAACHKLTDQRVVGPGWKGITEKRTPEWIMNMTTNVDIMLEEDPVAQELLKECLVRMPNQNLTVKDARDVLEFIYKNDGYAVGE